MDGVDEDHWSVVAAEWSELWGDLADPVRLAIIDAAQISTGSRVLDVGCGSGEFILALNRVGAIPAGIDPADGMVAIARARVPGADIRLGSVEKLPWPDHTFDVVTAVNALQFAEDTLEALAEMSRVTVPGGLIAIANWAEGDRNDLNTIEAALATAAGEEPLPDGDLRVPGGLDAVLRDAGLDPVASGVTDVPWDAFDEQVLVRGVLMGEDEQGIAEATSNVLAAALPFRTHEGGYHLVNAFRYAIGRTPEQAAQGDSSEG